MTSHLSRMTISTRILVEAGFRRGIDITVLSSSKNTFLVTLGGREHIWKSTSFGGSISSSRLTGDKALTHKLLQHWEYKVPEARIFSSKDKEEALAWAKQKKSVVFKPVQGAHGLGITVLPHGGVEAERAWDLVLETLVHSSQVQIEEYIGGEDYRFLVVGGRCIYVMHRMPAMIHGDGQLSIQRLIDRENSRPARGKTRYASFYSPIEVDAQLLENLAREGFDLDSIPEEGQKVILRRVCNAGKGGTERDISIDIPQALKDDAVELARKLDMDILAVDVRSENITAAASLRDIHILELNATPGITLGMAGWIADAVWDALLEKYDQ